VPLAVGVDGKALLARYRQLGLAIGSGAMPGYTTEVVTAGRRVLAPV
jgi:hypothetical protein